VGDALMRLVGEVAAVAAGRVERRQAVQADA
jgi:hypothetical protein